MDAANCRYQIAVRLPSPELVEAWQNAGRAVLQKKAENRVPVAKAVPVESLKAAGIELAAVPIAKEVRNPDPAPAPAPAPAEEFESEPDTEREPLAKTSVAEWVEEERRVVARASSRAKPKLVKTRTESLFQDEEESILEEGWPPPNGIFRHLEEVKSSKPQGQRRNRGMSHPEGGRVWWAAVVTVITPIVASLTALVLLGALVMKIFYGQEFHWTISLLLLVFPACLILYVSQGTKVRCRLCGQKLFVPKNCRKHERATRSIFGYTFAVARSAMFLASYRCMLCGTKTRLKD